MHPLTSPSFLYLLPCAVLCLFPLIQCPSRLLAVFSIVQYVLVGTFCQFVSVQFLHYPHIQSVSKGPLCGLILTASAPVLPVFGKYKRSVCAFGAVHGW